MSTILRLLCLGPALLLLAGCVVIPYYTVPGVQYAAPVYTAPPSILAWPFYFFGGHQGGYGGWHGGGGWYGGGHGHH